MRLLLRLRWKPAAARTSVPRGVLFCLVSSCLHKTRLRKAWSHQTAACSTVEGVGTCTKQNVLPVPRPNSEGEAGLIPYRRSLCPPGWQKRPQPSQPQLKVQRGGAGRGGLNTACHVVLLYVSHTDSVRVGEAMGQHTGSCLLAGTNLEVLC